MKLQKWVHWPTLQEELSEHLSYLNGKILNAGGGHRAISIPQASEIVNMDICAMEGVDVVGDLESIPFSDQTFDGILNVAVLEHVRRPWVVVKEFHRVLKENGRLLCVVPFFQPIHYVPTDYFRYTPDGICSLLQDAGFKIEQCLPTHSLWHTLGWMGEDTAKRKGKLWSLATMPIAKIIWLLSKYGRHQCTTCPNALTVFAQK